MNLATLVALLALSTTAVASSPPVARVVGHAQVIDAIERADGSIVSLGADGLVVVWDDDVPLAWRRVDGAIRLVEDPDATRVVTTFETVSLDRDLQPGARFGHDDVVLCQGASPVWVRAAGGWQVLDAGDTSAPVDVHIESAQCSVIDDTVWLAGFDGVEAVVISHGPAGASTTRVPWDSGERPVVVRVDDTPALVLGPDRAVAASTGASLPAPGVVLAGWCADRSSAPTSPCREPRASVVAAVPVPRAPLDVVSDGRSLTIIDAHGWLHVTAAGDGRTLDAQTQPRPDSLVAGADAGFGVALVCDPMDADSRWTLQTLATGEAVALADVPGQCVAEPSMRTGAAVGRTTRALVEVSGPRSLRFTTADDLELGARSMLGASLAMGRDERRLVLTRRFDAACADQRIELIRATPGGPAVVIADLGCATDARLGVLHASDIPTGVLIDLNVEGRRMAIGVRYDGHVVALVPVPDDAIRLTRLETGSDGLRLDDIGAGVQHTDQGAIPVVTITSTPDRAVTLDEWGIQLLHGDHRIRIQRAGREVLIDDGRGVLSTAGWAERVVASASDDASLALAERWFGPPEAALDAATVRPRPILDRFRTWGDQIRERRAARRSPIQDAQD